MRLSHMLGRTLREAPADADGAGHALLLKAGLIYQVAPGIYAYTPLLRQVMRKVERIAREELETAGGQEVLLPALQPVELAERSGRDALLGETLFRLKDRRGRRLALAPTGEELAVAMVRQFLRSYRDLPLTVFGFQTRFHDVARPQGGPAGAREMPVVEGYRFDGDEAALDAGYRTMVETLDGVYRRCGLSAVPVAAGGGGEEGLEFLVLTPKGETEALFCGGCDYRATVERAELLKEDGAEEAPLALEPVHTPGIKTIEALATFLGLPRAKTLKVVLYQAGGRLVMAAIRGDLQVSEAKLARALGTRELRLASDEEVLAAGLVPGFASPVAVDGVYVLADDSVAKGVNLVAGGNRPDTHVQNARYRRDYRVDLVADIARAGEGDRCACCGGELRVARGIAVGAAAKWGPFYGETMGASYLDRDGKSRPILLASASIALGPLLAAVVELHHDERGIIWPPPIAPYEVHLVGLNLTDEAVAEAGERTYGELQAAGFAVLFDDRPETPGVKFNDADLLGMPVRVTVSKRSVASGGAEVVPRREKQATVVPWAELGARVGELLAD